MKKNIILLGAILFSSLAYSQVGINNEAPKATLDITAKTTDGTKPEGIIAPRLTGDQIKSGDAQYDTPQIGTIVYATSAVGGTPAGKTINITSPGYYYFDNTLVWTKFGSGASAAGTEPWKIQTTTNSATLNTDNIYQQGKVSIGSTSATAATDKQLEVIGDFKTNYVSGGIYNGINTNYTGLGTPANIMYVANNADLMSATNTSLLLVTPDLANIQSNKAATGGGTVAAYSTPNGGNVGFYANSVAANTTSSIWGYNNNGGQNFLELSHTKNGAESTNIKLEKSAGVNFNFKNPVNVLEGNYTFPRVNGTANQVLTTNGVVPNAQLSWQCTSSNQLRHFSLNP